MEVLLEFFINIMHFQNKFSKTAILGKLSFLLRNIVDLGFSLGILEIKCFCWHMGILLEFLINEMHF